MNNYISTAALYSPSESYLAHHGVKGQKWGVRRYQNEDGSLTPVGRRRYGTVENFNNAQQYRAAKKSYNKAFNDAYRHRIEVYSFKKSKRDAENERWDKALTKADELNMAKSAYKQSRKEAKRPVSLTVNKSDDPRTKKVKQDYNTLSDKEFFNKYSSSKNTYASRVKKYGGDPLSPEAIKKRNAKIAVALGVGIGAATASGYAVGKAYYNRSARKETSMYEAKEFLRKSKELQELGINTFVPDLFDFDIIEKYKAYTPKH